MKRYLFAAAALACLLLPLSGCQKAAGAESYTLARFENTDWGMSPQEVLEARGLSLDDVRIADVYEGSQPGGYQVYSLVAEEDVLDIPATVTYRFTENYIPAAQKELPPIGLTTVIVDFEDSGGWTAYEKQYGEEFTNREYYTAEDLDVSEELQQKVADFHQIRGNDTESRPEAAKEWAESMVQFYTQGEDGVCQVRYDGLNMAIADFLAEQEDPALEIMEEMGVSEFTE